MSGPFVPFVVGCFFCWWVLLFLTPLPVGTGTGVCWLVGRFGGWPVAMPLFCARVRVPVCGREEQTEACRVGGVLMMILCRARGLRGRVFSCLCADPPLFRNLYHSPPSPPLNRPPGPTQWLPSRADLLSRPLREPLNQHAGVLGVAPPRVNHISGPPPRSYIVTSWQFCIFFKQHPRGLTRLSWGPRLCVLKALS